jgi:hypothetical protein
MAFSLVLEDRRKGNAPVKYRFFVVRHRLRDDAKCNGMGRNGRYLGPRCSAYPVSDLYWNIQAQGPPVTSATATVDTFERKPGAGYWIEMNWR